MSTPGWIAVAVAALVWAVCAAVTGWLVTRHQLEVMMRKSRQRGGRCEPLRTDVATAAVWGLTAAGIWPLVVAVWGLLAVWEVMEDHLVRPADGFVTQTLTGTRRQARAEQARQRERRIRELERQLKIGDQ